MTAPALRLHDRGAAIPPADRGQMMTAAAVSADIWQGKYSAKWVGSRMGPEIGFKIGSAWHFYQVEAEQWRDRHIEKQKRAARGER